MNFKHTIAENLGLIQWLLTWLILVGVLLAGYYWLPIAFAKHQELVQLDIQLRATGSGHINGLAFGLPFFLTLGVTLFGTALISLIWQFRVVKTACRGGYSSQGKSICGKTVR